MQESDLFISESQKNESTNEYLNLKAKELNIVLDRINTNRDTEQVKLLITLQAHQSVSVRRKVAKILLDLGTQEIVEDLKNWQKNETDKNTHLLLESTISKIKGLKTRISEENEKIYKVGEVILMIKSLISSQKFSVEGEIIQPQFYGNILYFSLKDDQETRIDCRILAFKLNKLDFALNEGLQVIIGGKFTLNKSSKLVFDVEFIKLTGEGELARNLKLLEEKLTKEGLLDPNRKRKLSRLPRNILLLASKNSAAINDFQKVLFERRLGGINLYHLNIKTQGVGAEQEMLEKLEEANVYAKDYAIETIIITRGGGSKDDLALFNSERVVRGIHGLICPCIVAIGHERDFTLGELVADVRASTPSNAAQLCSHTSLNATQEVQNIFQQSLLLTQNRIQMAKSYNDKFYKLIIFDLTNKVKEQKLIIQNLNYYVKSLIEKSKIFINNKVNDIIQNISIQTKNQQNLTENLWYKLIQDTQNYLQLYKHKIQIISQQIDNNNPNMILKKGFAIITQNKKHIQFSNELDPKNKINITFQDKDISIN
jgi:exodeoxyribonuclease VII large subunit